MARRGSASIGGGSRVTIDVTAHAQAPRDAQSLQTTGYGVGLTVDGQATISNVTIRLNNKISDAAALPEHVAGTPALIAGITIQVSRSTMLTSIRLLATTNASLATVLENGQRVPVNVGAERGHPSLQLQVDTTQAIRRAEFPPIRTDSSGCPARTIQPLVDTVAPVLSVAEYLE